MGVWHLMMTYVVTMFCVVALAAGQMLFKLGANATTGAGAPFPASAAAALASAVLIYAASTVAWVWVLRSAELGRVYPLMAMGFILVPLGSHLLFGERFQASYFAGVGLIVAGIFLCVRS